MAQTPYGRRPRTRTPAGAVKVYRYPKPKKETPLRAPRNLDREGATPAPKRYRIKGKRATDLEWRVYQALRRLGWTDDEIDFQVPVLGGRWMGGLSLDFVVWTPAMPIIIEPSGDYWHTATLQQINHDRERQARLREAWRRPFRYYSLGSGELLSDEMAERRLLHLVGRR